MRPKDDGVPSNESNITSSHHISVVDASTAETVAYSERRACQRDFVGIVGAATKDSESAGTNRGMKPGDVHGVKSLSWPLRRQLPFFLELAVFIDQTWKWLISSVGRAIDCYYNVIYRSTVQTCHWSHLFLSSVSASFASRLAPCVRRLVTRFVERANLLKRSHNPFSLSH